MSGLDNLSVLLHLRDDTIFTVEDHSDQATLKIGGRAPTSITIFVSNLQQADLFANAGAKLQAIMCKQQKPAQIIEEQAARIAELEKQLAEKVTAE